MRVAVAGQGALGLALVEGIAASKHTLVALVQDPRRTWRERLVARLGGLPSRVRVPVYWGPDGVQERCDVLVSGDYGLRLPDLGIPMVNAHWSLLPHHRGGDPGGAVILSGDAETGLSFHAVVHRFDAGDLLDQVRYPVPDRATSRDLYELGAGHARERIGPLLDRIEAEGIGFGTPQDLQAGSYFRKRRLDEVELDFERPAAELDRLIRSCSSPRAWFVDGARVFVTRASFDSSPADGRPGDRRGRTFVTGEGTLTIDMAFREGWLGRVWTG